MFITKVNVIDQIMGSGKTTAMIRYIKESPPEEKFIFITPYLTEVERVIKECKERSFKEPQVFGSKLNGIKGLIKKGENIVSTHALFNHFDEEVLEMIRGQNYTLIMDEVADVADKLVITDADLKIITQTCVEVREDGRLQWINPKYEGKYEEFKKAIENSKVIQLNGKTLLWLLPIDSFTAFKTVFIMTYMFDAQMQRYYFDLHGVEYTNLYIEGNSPKSYRLTNKKIETDKREFAKKIHICNDAKLNQIGQDKYALSKTWYERHTGAAKMKQLCNNTYSFFRRRAKTASDLNLWTTFASYQKEVAGKGYAKGFLSCNARATNQYRHKTAVAYLLNRFVDPNIKNYFHSHGIVIDEDRYALSEMLQFIWRSAIRDGEDIDIYIPSKRMRTLLIEWLREGSE